MSLTASTWRIRRAEAADTPALQRIESDSAQRYWWVEETRFCLDLPVRSIEEHQYARDQGLALVAEIRGAPIGFILTIPLDGRAHILELAVSLGHQGCGCGRALIKAAEDWAVRKGFHEVSLTTLRDLAWNAPFYLRLGYDEFDAGPGRLELRELIAQEKAAGVHAAPRVTMRKILSAKIGSNTSFVIRQERRNEFRDIHELVRTAFASARHVEGDEQHFVDRQRSAQSYVPELASVLEDDGRLIAHVMLTRSAISTSAGPSPILLLACVAVAAEYRNRGLGTALIEAALRRAALDLDHAAVILVGHPDYYRRLGFAPSIEFGISNENRIEPNYVQVRELITGALTGVSGTIVLPS